MHNIKYLTQEKKLISEKSTVTDAVFGYKYQLVTVAILEFESQHLTPNEHPTESS